MIAIGAGKVAEGITRFCPMLYMLGLTTVQDDELEGSPVREERRMQTPVAQYET